MGCTPSPNKPQAMIPNQYMARVIILSRIDSPYNINRKYEHLSKIDTTKELGQGFKRTYAYNALVTKQQIQAKRKQFWETRIGGHPQVWMIIKRAIQSNNGHIALTELQQNRVSMLNNSIQMCVDMQFNKYQIPIFCINEPLSYSDQRVENRNLQLEYEDIFLDIIIRSVKYPSQDLKFREKSTSDIAFIKNMLRGFKSLSPSTMIRLFYNGRQMMDDKTLGNYSFVSGNVIQAMIIVR